MKRFRSAQQYIDRVEFHAGFLGVDVRGYGGLALVVKRQSTRDDLARVFFCCGDIGWG
ncbi:MAG: hypothetical protein H6728_12845 [Myxococcales bacterium]|nr:hypothetical protein [Myxococcales bacterium]MCB9643956.1 hypothetical protein [Myxococcales bacterium]